MNRALNKITNIKIDKLQNQPDIELIFTFNTDRFQAIRFNTYVSRLEIAEALHTLANNILHDEELK